MEKEEEESEVERYLVRGPDMGGYSPCKIIVQIPLKSGGTERKVLRWMIPTDNLSREGKVINMQERNYAQNGRLLNGGYTDLSEEEKEAVDNIDESGVPI